MEIFPLGVQAPGLDPGVCEMCRLVGPTLGDILLLKNVS